MKHARAGEPCICGDYPGGACDQALCTIPSPQDIDALEQRLDDADYARRDLQKRYDALVAENAKLREALRQLTYRSTETGQLLSIKADVTACVGPLLDEPSVQPSGER